MKNPIYFEKPTELNDCSAVLKVIYPNFNMFCVIADNDIKTLEGLFLISPPPKDELEFLLTRCKFVKSNMHVVDQNYNVDIKHYYLCIKAICDFIYNCELGTLFSSEVTLFDGVSIEKAKEKVKKWVMEYKQNSDDLFADLFRESLKGGE